MTRFVRTPSETAAPVLLGGKASVLARLPADVAVPAWFVVTPEAFRASLPPAARAAWDDGGAPDLDALCTAPDVVAEVRAALDAVGGDRWAVRSSAADEDGAGASFAGQYVTVLDVPTADVPARLVDVWRSAFTPSVDAYRRVQGIPHVSVPAVLVQQMIEPRAAGVAFSADPATGQRGVAVVAAVAGLGDALVGGADEGDLYRVDRAGAVTRPDGAGVLADDDARRVAALARRLERHFGAPQDVEWAIDAAGTLWTLQSRPITTLRALPDPDGALFLWDNANISESYAGVTTPLTFGFARTAYTHVYKSWLRLMGVSPARLAAHEGTFRRLIGLVRGRLYYGLPAWYALLSLLPGFRLNRPFMEAMMGLRDALPPELMPSAPPATRRARIADGFRLACTVLALLHAYRTLDRRSAAFRARVQDALEGPDVATLRLDELAAAYRRVEDRLLTAWDAPLVNDFLCMILFGSTRALAARWAPSAPGLHATLVTPGADGETDRVISAEPPRLVRALAALVRSDLETVAALQHAPVPEALAALRQHPEAARLFDAYLARFGDRCPGELKLESVPLTDDSAPLLRGIGAIAARPEAPEPTPLAPDVALRAAMPAGLRRWVLGALAQRARRLVAGRENLRFERTRVFGLARRLFREMGRRLAAEGVLDAPDAVFYLEPHEILGFAEGTATTWDLKGLARVRRAEFAGWESMPAPADRFRTTGAVGVANRFEGDPTSGAAPVGEAMTGLGCGPGVAEGPVRVVRDPRGVVLAPGEILVAERTDPGWILLFGACAGLVVERGSLLSHAAIVAREMGLPAVVSVPGACAWLRDGDRVRVDGATGRVTRLAPAGPSGDGCGDGLASSTAPVSVEVRNDA